MAVGILGKNSGSTLRLSAAVRLTIYSNSTLQLSAVVRLTIYSSSTLRLSAAVRLTIYSNSTLRLTNLASASPLSRPEAPESQPHG